MRKSLSKEITLTTVRLATFEFPNGIAEGTIKAVELKPEILIGLVTKEKAQKAMNKKHKNPVTVIDATTETNIYEMSIKDFLKHAKIKKVDEK